ncbi:MAG: HAMP domain-containing histidine kinase [Roseburia sp.]|nr:HAMP domain-containing histidine kinase [Roseburia sp.]
MKLWEKMSLITAAALLVSAGISGSTVIYRCVCYNQEKTVENYMQQVKSTAYAVGKELDYEPFERFSETTAYAYYAYVLRKYGEADYILIAGDEVVANRTPYSLVNPADERWGAAEGSFVVQERESRHILVVGRRVPAGADRDYKLVLVQDISPIYADIRAQIFFYVIIYAGTVVVTVFLIFLITRRVLLPLQELERAAKDISEGRLERRARVRARDEIGGMAEAFNAMAAQIERQVRELTAESERRRQLLGSLTHELKTPMTAIMGYADSLLHVRLREEQREKALWHIHNECGRLERISSKLMSLIGLHENGSICMEEVSVRELFECVAGLEEENLRKRHLALEYSCESVVWRLDRDLFESLLINLIDNGAKASREGQTIFMTGLSDRIVVRDQGCGIPEEELPRVTEAFYMVDKARSRKSGGSGLGLALCERIAGLHGARLRIESVLGEGTTVTVLF